MSDLPPRALIDAIERSLEKTGRRFAASATRKARTKISAQAVRRQEKRKTSKRSKRKTARRKSGA